MKKHHFQLDPTVKKQLQSITIIQDARVQEFIDNPSSIPTFLDFRVDYAFKYILGHKEALLKLLNDILPVRVDAVEYLPNEIPVISEKEKRSAFDVICTNKDTGERFLCEMQRLQDSDMDDRLLFYGCSLVLSFQKFGYLCKGPQQRVRFRAHLRDRTHGGNGRQRTQKISQHYGYGIRQTRHR